MCKMSPAEKNYSQIDKEVLSIFGKISSIFVWKNFYIVTNHKPLIHLFHPHKSVPPLASARIQRCALILGAYSYKIQHRPGKDHANADGLSRLPLSNCPDIVPVPGEVLMTTTEISKSPISAKEIKNWTARDPLLSSIFRYISFWVAYESDSA